MTEPQVGLFMPLLIGLDGVDKMSKSKGNAIGIDEPPLAMFEKLMSISDAMMPQYYELCTDVPLEEASVICDGARTHPMEAKKRLAREVITVYHSADAAGEARHQWEVRHSERLIPDDAPDFLIPAELFDQSLVRLSALVAAAGFAATGSEAKRLIQQGGVALNGEKLTDPSQMLAIGDGMVLSSGRRKFARLRLPTSAN